MKQSASKCGSCLHRHPDVCPNPGDYGHGCKEYELDMCMESKRGKVMSRKAYLVGFIQTKGEVKYMGCGIFSEDHPTMGPAYPFTIIETEGETYKEACDKIHEALEYPSYTWAKETLK